MGLGGLGLYCKHLDFNFTEIFYCLALNRVEKFLQVTYILQRLKHDPYQVSPHVPGDGHHLLHGLPLAEQEVPAVAGQRRAQLHVRRVHPVHAAPLPGVGGLNIKHCWHHINVTMTMPL